MAKRIDFTSEFNDSNESPKLNTQDLEAGNIEVPPELVPEPVAQIPPIPESDAASHLVSARQNRGGSKAFLVFALLLLAVGGGAYWKLKLAPTDSVSTNSELNATSPAAATQQSDEATKARLKELWKLGAAAKKRGDFATARSVWKEGLKIQPNNAGFRESIDKLSSERH